MFSLPSKGVAACVENNKGLFRKPQNSLNPEIDFWKHLSDQVRLPVHFVVPVAVWKPINVIENSQVGILTKCQGLILSLIFIDPSIIASAASNHWLRVKGPDKQLQNEDAQILSVDFLNGLYLSKYLLPTLKILDLGGD